jgi:two-component system sensor histidine kinase KdpD
VVLARVGLGDLRLAGASSASPDLAEADLAAARWTLEKGEATGRGADTLPGARWLFLPLRTSRLVAGVVGIARSTALNPAERRRLAAMGDQAATALERAHVSRALEESRVETEAERLRGTMLASLSHDLRTPIAGILGAASSLRAYGDRHDVQTRRDLLATIEGEAARMQRYVAKLLDMTRLDAGGIPVRIEPVEPGDVVSAVAARANGLAGGSRIVVEVEAGLPLIRADATLLDQALFNLVENALVHGGSGKVTIRARRDGESIAFDVLDNGAGIPAGDEGRIFDRFVRGRAPAEGGTGLGLAIVKGFAGLMGAKATARNRTGAGGAVFSLTFPPDKRI